MSKISSSPASLGHLFQEDAALTIMRWALWCEAWQWRAWATNKKEEKVNEETGTKRRETATPSEKSDIEKNLTWGES